jgi:hypothetical protein
LTRALAGASEQTQRRFVSMDDKQVKVRQLNPPKQIAYARKDVVAIHRIVGASFRD